MTDFDAVVLGAGPAGCAAATLLARRSHRVAMVRPTSPPAAPLAESVPPSARRILDELGFLEAVTRAGFEPNLGNTVWWAGDDARREDFPKDAFGFHTERGSLETVLTAEAERAGVTVLDDTSARSAEESPGSWQVRCTRDRGQERILRAPWLVDATGRHGLLARREGREPDRSTTTLALVRRWHRPGGWAEERGHTLVESYEDGWAWSVPVGPELRCFTAMVDQRQADLRGPDVGAMLDEELSRTVHLGRVLEGAVPAGDAWACPASLYTATRFGRRGLLLAGDAGSFIDPLSSFGVKKALSSGWLAGITIHTALVDPSAAGMAVDFFEERERHVWKAYRGASIPFFEAGAQCYCTPYWVERAEAARRAASDEPEGSPPPTADEASRWEGGPVDPDHITAEVPEEDVRRAFETIRARPTLNAVSGSTLRTFQGPGIEGHRIVLQDRPASDLFPRGIRWVRGVDLGTLVEVAPRHAQVPDGWAAYNAVAPPVSLPDYLTALATAFAAGFLRHEEA